MLLYLCVTDYNNSQTSSDRGTEKEGSLVGDFALCPWWCSLGGRGRRRPVQSKEIEFPQVLSSDFIDD